PNIWQTPISSGPDSKPGRYSGRGGRRTDGRSYAHTFDPRTGAPVPHAPAAVTVLATEAMHADAGATAMTVLGVDDGLAYARNAALAVRFVLREDGALHEFMSPAFECYLAATLALQRHAYGLATAWF
ncbi:FAD:protein FMN transferase, partial [Xanthomonas fragariae]